MAFATITPKVADDELFYQDINELIANSEYLYSGFDVQHNPASGVHEAVTATTVNKLTLTAPASGATLTLANGSTLATVGAYSTTLTATGTTALTLPTSGTLATTGSKLSAFAATTSAELAGVISDETGSGALVFADSPVLTTQLTVPKIVTASGALTLQPASGSGLTVTLGTTGDFAVNSNQLYVDTSTGFVGAGTASPDSIFRVYNATPSANVALSISGSGNAVPNFPAVLVTHSVINTGSGSGFGIKSVITSAAESGIGTISSIYGSVSGGTYGDSRGRSVGVYGTSGTVSGGVSIGVVGTSDSASTYSYGVVATLGAFGSAGIFTGKSALYCSNGDTTGCIASFYDNTTYVMGVCDGGRVGIGTTAPDKQLEVNSSTGDCLRLTYNDSNGSAAYYVDHAVSAAGAGTVTTSGGDYTIHTADNYTLALTHGAWDDLMVAITGARLPSSGNPAWVAAATTGWSCELLEFSKSATNTIYFTVQMPHGYQVGTDIYCHVHWASQAAKTVAEGVRVAWSLALTWTDIGEDRSAEVTRTNYLPVQMRSGAVYTAADIVANRHYLTDFTVVAAGGSGGAISGANMSLSSVLCGSLSRLGADATYDTYDDEVYLLGLDFHYQKDTLGSRTELAK